MTRSQLKALNTNQLIWMIKQWKQKEPFSLTDAEAKIARSIVHRRNREAFEKARYEKS